VPLNGGNINRLIIQIVIAHFDSQAISPVLS